MYPEYVEVNGKQYKINTDFRVAIECNRIADDTTIGNFERSLGIICTLFGNEAIDDINENFEVYEKLLNLATKYILCENEPIKSKKKKKPDMDFIKDAGYIASSFQYDYQYNPYEMEYCHWYKFYNDLNNLSNSEFGNCCILNRVRNFRNLDVRKIKDEKARQEAIELQKQLALEKSEDKKGPTEKQKESARELYKRLGLRRE